MLPVRTRYNPLQRRARLPSGPLLRRPFHTTRVCQQEVVEARVNPSPPPDLGKTVPAGQRQPKIRERLMLWQEQYGQPNIDLPQEPGIESTSGLVRLGISDELGDVETAEDRENFNVTNMRELDEPEDLEEPHATLHRGDLVEIA